jgi:protein involved in polysaccharide export with SLBB domain
MKRQRYRSQSCPFAGLFRQAGMFFTFALLCSCSTSLTIPPLTSKDIPQLKAAGNYPERQYRLEPGDTITIAFPFQPEMDQGETIVPPDGKITLPLVGEVIVTDKTTAELEKFLVKHTSDRLRNPEVVVSVTSFAPKTVYVGGEVLKAGEIPYFKGLTPLQAIVTAGGFLETAKPDSVVLIRPGDQSSRQVLARTIDLASTLATGAREPLSLAPHDVLFVPRTSIANADLWVQQHMIDLVPFFRGTGIGYIMQ